VDVRPEHWDFKEHKPTKNHPKREWLENVIANAVAKKRVELTNPFLEPYPMVEPEPVVYSEPVAYPIGYSEPVQCPHEPIQCPKPDPLVVPVPIQCPPKPVADPDPLATDKTFLFNLYRNIIAELNNDGRCGSARSYKYALNNISKYTGDKDILLKDITVEWLNRYKQWLNNQKLKDTTISHLYRDLRAAFNRAIDLGYISRDAYPFVKFKVSKFNKKTEKRAIPKEEMHKIVCVKLDAANRKLILAKDLFVFSYYTGGINFVDMAYLTKEDIKEKQITFKRKKTEVGISLPLQSVAEEILSRYNQGKGYIFPIFDAERHKTPKQQENRRSKMLSEVNKSIREVGKIAGVEGYQKLTMYTARHTFATILFKSKGNAGLVRDAMGHKNLTTTQDYLASFNKDELNEAFQCL
jgi:site-specific recombinase XerD